MKRIIKTVFCSMLFLLFISGNTVFAEASNTLPKDELLELEKDVNKAVNDELKGIIQSQVDNDVSIEIGDISVQLDDETLEKYDYDKERVIEAFKEEIKDWGNGLKRTEIEIQKKVDSNLTNNFETYSVKNMGTYYVAKVWAGVPAIGHGYINQDFNAKKSGGKFTSVKLLGSSYKSGVMLGTWSHNRSWVTIPNSKTVAEIRMKGVLDYVFKGSPVSLPATFLKTVKPSDIK